MNFDPERIFPTLVPQDRPIQVDDAPNGRHIWEQPVDRDLIVAAQRGDQAAFVDLVRFRGGRLFAIAHRILRDVDRAEDALQEALVIAWRDLPSLRDPDRFDAWVHRLLTNVCIAEAGRERKRISNLYVLPIDDTAAPDELLGVADRDQLDRGFRRLTPDERAILVLRHFVGYEPTEIADLLGLAAGTIRSRLHHAHRAMRAALEAEARGSAVGGRSR
jgi:RNA polymerase sigma-70 factor (ECF subfamily)